MPAESEVQQKAFAMARAARKGKIAPGSLKGAAKDIYGGEMSTEKLGDWAKTKHKDIPHRKKPKKKKMTEQVSFEEWLQERDPDLFNEVGTTTADVALFKRHTIPAARRQFAPAITFGQEDEFFRKKKTKD